MRHECAKYNSRSEHFTFLNQAKTGARANASARAEATSIQKIPYEWSFIRTQCKKMYNVQKPYSIL